MHVPKNLLIISQSITNEFLCLVSSCQLLSRGSFSRSSKHLASPNQKSSTVVVNFGQKTDLQTDSYSKQPTVQMYRWAQENLIKYTFIGYYKHFYFYFFRKHLLNTLHILHICTKYPYKINISFHSSKLTHTLTNKLWNQDHNIVDTNNLFQ